MVQKANWYIGALERGFAVLKTFGRDTPMLRVSEISSKTGMSRFAVRRFLKTFQELGYIGVDDERYFLKPGILEIGYSYLAASQIPNLIQRYLEELVSKTGGSSAIGVMDGHEVIYIARATAPMLYNLAVGLHTRQPAYVFSIGRILLANMASEALDEYLETVPLKRYTDRTIVNQKKLRAQLATERKRGWSAIQDEMSYGVMALAVPIHDRRGRVVAALNLNPHGAIEKLDDLVSLHLDDLKKTAQRIEKELVGSLINFGT
jgi:IclR family pca regulon transcriptional regulator